MLLRAQRSPVQINKNGKPVAVVISAEEYESIEALKLRLLQSRAAQANVDIAAGNLVDGEAFFLNWNPVNTTKPQKGENKCLPSNLTLNNFRW